jgi:hypothetical protein
MTKRIIISLFLLTFLVSAANATVIIRGTRGRRLLRHQYLVKQWENDKLRIYNKYGFPIHRLRVRGYGRVREHWKYYEEGLEFIFDEESNLVETNRFWPEDRRERFKRY